MPPTSPTLRTLKNGQSSPRTKSHSATVVAISSPRGIRPEQWPICQPESLLTTGFPVKVISFDYAAGITEDFTWESFLKLGGVLVDKLVAWYGAQDAEAILDIHVQAERYKGLKDIITGLVFIGCPHSANPDRRTFLYDRALLIAQTAGLVTSRRVALRLLAEDDCMLIELCRSFDEANVRIDILSVYTLTPTSLDRFRRVGPNRKESLVLVDGKLALIDSDSYEEMISIPTDYKSLPKFADSNGRLDEYMVKKFQHLLRNAAELLRGRQTPRNDSPHSELNMPLRALQQPAPELKPLIEEFTIPRPTLSARCLTIDISRQRNAEFCGRENVLERLDEGLLQGCHMAAVYGPGGFGKSEVALEWAYSRGELFDAVFWIASATIEELRRDLGRIASSLKIPGPSGTVSDPYEAREIAKAWLKDPIKTFGSRRPDSPANEARWLLVLDGADNLELLKELEVLRGRGSILLTSRDPESSQWVSPLAEGLSYNQCAVEIQVLEEEAAARMLRSLARREEDDLEAARQVAQALGGWPLAISQMAGIIRNEYLTLGEFAQRYSDLGERQNLQALDVRTDSDADQHETMVSTIRMAGLSDQATVLLQLCAMLAPDCIQEVLFTRPGPEPPASDILKLNPQDFGRARAELLRASLMKRNLEKHQLWMHRVVQDTVRNSMDNKTFDRAFRGAVAVLAIDWRSPGPEGGDDLEIREHCKTLFPHVVHLHSLHPPPSEHSTSSGKLVQPCVKFAMLLNDSGWLQWMLGNTQGLKGMLDLALSICKQLPASETFDTLSDVYHGLGAWANLTNHPTECLEYNKRYMEMREEAVMGGAPPDPRTAAAWNQYGTGEMMMKRWPEAKAAFRKSIEIYASLKNDVPCKDSLPIVNLAIAEWLTGDYDAALRLLEPGLLAREEAFDYMDSRSFRTGRFYHALGNVRYSQNRLDESEIWHKRALKQYQSTIGNWHHRTADVCHRVAEHCLRQGHPVYAGQLIDQALRTWSVDESSFGPEIARTTFLKARQAALRGNPVEARELRKRAAVLRQAIVPEDRRSADELEAKDFDELVAFWSR